MHTIVIREAKIEKFVPEELAECDAQQYLDMCELIFKFQAQMITYDELRIHAIYKLMNMKPVKEFIQEEEENKLSNAYRLSELIDTFFVINDQDQKVIKQNYINNPVPKFKPLLHNYYGPSDGFQNIKFGEYTDALRLFFQFNATGDYELLFALTAVLYRKKKSFHWFKKRLNNYDGDIREPYNQVFVDKRANVFKQAPIGFVYGTYLLFSSFQQFISSAQVPWGSSVLDFSILFQTGEASEPETIPGIGMDTVLFSMAESGAFGTLKQVQNTNLWEVLVRMYDIRKRDLDNQKREENARSKQP
jgi:hypothetical protein